MKKNKQIILIYLLIIGLFLISPINTFARNSAKGKGNNCTGKCKTCANNVCKSDFKISMDVSNYDRNSWKTSQVGEYVNTVSDRNVTVTVPQTALNQGAVYRIRIFYGKYGTIDSDFFNLDSDLDDLDNDDLDDGIKVFKTKLQKDNGVVNKSNSAISVSRQDKSNTVTVTIKAGYEAVVVAYLNKDVKTNSTCKNNDNEDFKVTCINGKDTEVDDGAISLSGVSASEYVQNPNATIEVKNLRGKGKEYGAACDNAYNGIYDSETATDEKSTADDKKYTITDPTALAYYRQHYYPQMLGTYYCDKSYVAFNLSEAQIAKLSNRALKMFYKSWKLSEKTKSANGYSDTYTEIDTYVKSLQDKKDEKGNPIVKTVTNTNVSLACEKDLQEGINSKEYLYVDKKAIKTEKLSDGSTPTVCDTICYEHLTVSYDPPVASIAGLCFTYKVTVKSETNCGVKYNKDVIEGNGSNGGLVGKLQKEMCAPVPICSAKSTHTQAGPSEEFDSCVKGCDGGKYSQECINKCYTEVYENKDKTSSNIEESKIEQTNNTIKETANLNLLTTKENNNSNVLKIKTWKENQLEKYSSKSTAIPKCDSKSEILKNIDTCKEYFFEAKTLYPKGHYNKSGTAWKSDLRYNSDKDNIWSAIGRASPFYLRDQQSTKELILAILDKDPHNGRTYFIDKDGIKRQYRGSWTCDEDCKYTGCSAKNALTTKSFVNSLNISENSDSSTNKDDMDKIDAALEDCSVTSACETTETTSNFEIKILNPRKENENNEVDKTGTTELKKTDPTSENIPCPDEGESEENADFEDRFSMFVPANEDINSKYGILGLCYDNETPNPQYKTTITFPGSWINYKARKIEYDKKTCNSGWELKGGYFCSAYDSTDVNAEWWKWRMQMKDSDGNIIYPTFQEPKINNNIQASAKNFGKYNWNINYSCFYGIYNGTAECEDCTKLQDYKFKVIDAGNLFTDNSNQRQGYNWTSAATVTENSGVNVNDARAITYTINPQKYINYINTYEKDEKIYDTKDEDYYIYLSSDGIKHIKELYKNRAYADYDENGFKEDPNVKGLARYTSELLKTLSGYGNKDIYIKTADGIEKTNNNYSNLNSLLGTD